MSVATLTFSLPEEAEEHHIAIHGADYRSALAALDERLRQLAKYGNEREVAAFTPQMARDWLWEEIRAVGLEDIR